MMKIRVAAFFCSLSVLIFSFSSTYADPVKKGLEIATKSNKSNDGFRGESAEMEMILINAQGEKIERKMVWKTMEVSGEGDKSIITFLWPADVKGSKMLTHSHKKGDDDQWLFLPALKKVKRISSRSKTGSFMGSEFSYEDLGSQELEKYDYKFIKDTKLNGKDHWIVERYPKDKDSGYKRQVMWVNKANLQPSKVEYYDRKNEILKTANFKNYSKIQKWWRASSLEMVNHQTRKSSVLNWKSRKLGEKFSEREFHKNSLTE